MDEWHYHCDQFDNARMGEHGWRKSHKRPPGDILSRKSTHVANVNCHKLCREGLWPIPLDLLIADPVRDSGAFGYQQKEHAESWWVSMSGRVYLLIRHNGQTSNMVCEMQWLHHQPYSWIPGSERFGRVWKWVGVQSKSTY